MDLQIKKFEENRRAKVEAELQTNAALVDKNQKIKMGQRKFQRLKTEVDEMWAQLEHSYNIDLITKLEDELKNKNTQMTKLREEVQAMQKV